MSWLLGQVNLRAFLSLEILWSDLLHVKLFRRGFVVSQSSLGDKNCLSLWWDLFRHFIRLLDSSKHWEGSHLPFLWVAGPFCSNELCSFVTTFESSVVLSPPLKGPFIIQGSWKMKPQWCCGRWKPGSPPTLKLCRHILVGLACSPANECEFTTNLVKCSPACLEEGRSSLQLLLSHPVLAPHSVI